MHVPAVAMMLFAAVASQAAQPASGRWDGVIQLPGQELAIQVDLARSEQGEWAGEIDIPAQSLKDFPLTGITVKETSLSFHMQGVPGKPTFEGVLSSDGQSISGQFTQGSSALNFRLKRIGDAQITPPTASTPIDPALEGNWEGTLEAGSAKLRLMLKLSKGPDGNGRATMDSLDQGANDIPVSAVVQRGTQFALEVKPVAGAYKAVWNKQASELSGTWSQGPNQFPLVLRRAKPAEAK